MLLVQSLVTALLAGNLPLGQPCIWTEPFG